MKLLSIVALISLTSSLFADQCAYISKSEAAWAQKNVNKGMTLLSYCEQCGDDEPKFITVSTVVNKSVGYAGYYGLFVNGVNVDLAYTFVQTGENTYTNLAKLVGCQAVGVSEFLSLP